MTKRNTVEKDLNPAYVLHALREGNLRTKDQLCQHLGLGQFSVSMWTEGALPSDRGHETLDRILEELGRAGLVTSDDSGHLKVSPQLREMQKALRLSLRQLSHRFMNEQSPQAVQIRKALATLKAKPQDAVVEELTRTLREVHVCCIHQCYLGAIVLAGRALEVSLKHALTTRNIEYEENWSLGKLIERLRKEAPELVLESSHGRIFDIITQSRNCAVHPGKKNFAPTEGEVTLVVAAMLVVVQKLVLDE